jgi:hypothetical protein
MSGTNAHVIVEQASPAEVGAGDEEAPAPTVFSAVLPWAYRRRTVTSWRSRLGGCSRLSTTNRHFRRWVSGFAGHARTPHEHRADPVVADRADFVHGLPSLTVSSAPGVPRGSVRPGGAPPSCSPARGRSGSICEVSCTRFSRPRCPSRTGTSGRLLKDVAWGDSDTLNQTEYMLAALFAVEIALLRLVESWGAPGLPCRAFDRGVGRGTWSADAGTRGWKRDDSPRESAKKKSFRISRIGSVSRQ